jgi:hypothetical protein
MGTSNAPQDEALRAFDHLADELELLLFALGKMMAKEARHV